MNKKIKVIELFLKIANKEEMPKRLKYRDDILKYDEDIQDYIGISATGSSSFFNYLFVNNPTETFINDEVEILEDEKEIDRIEEIPIIIRKHFIPLTNDYIEKRTIRDPVELADKINEVIRYINKKENK